MADSIKIIGVDFTSRPTRSKPITLAMGSMNDAGALLLADVECCVGLPAFHTLLDSLPPWIGGFDFPFGLPRAFVAEQGWPVRGKHAWRQIAAIACAETRAELVVRCRAYCDARPAGQKFAHRAVDRLAGSSPSMKWVNPPVLFMFHAGLPVLRSLDCQFPGLTEGGHVGRVALEAYPGFLARRITTASYKSDDRTKQTSAREAARVEIVNTLLQANNPLGIKLEVDRSLRRRLVEDPTGDTLDAAICALQAAWGLAQRQQNFGLPPHVDPIEGWIISV
ncbi:MAG: DUF429 domain-containing protein [Aeromicrobium sp.]|nr:DUF429 domain-containing protein [Burkholderiales bacterium]